MGLVMAGICCTDRALFVCFSRGHTYTRYLVVEAFGGGEKSKRVMIVDIEAMTHFLQGWRGVAAVQGCCRAVAGLLQGPFPKVCRPQQAHPAPGRTLGMA